MFVTAELHSAASWELWRYQWFCYLWSLLPLFFFCLFVVFFYQPNNPERRKVTNEVYYNVSPSQILNTTSSVWSRFKGINQFEISKDLSRLLKQSQSLNIYQAKTKLRVHSTLFKTNRHRFYSVKLSKRS